MLALFVLAVAVLCIHEHGVLLVLVIKIIDDLKLELVAFIIGEYDDIPFFFHGCYHLST